LDMLLRSLENFGGKGSEVRAAFLAPEAKGAPILATLRRLGDRLKEEGAASELCGDYGKARETYLRSAVYYLTADWLSVDPAIMAENYKLMLPAFDAYRRLCDPPVEKISLSFPGGDIFAHFRAPRAAHGARLPAILLIQGNDEVKEFNTRVEEAILAHGMAVLDLDPPGWGESYLSGSRCGSGEDYRRAIAAAVDYLCGRAEVAADSIGILGMSFGGLLAPYAASLEPRIKAVAALGGPSCSTARMRSLRKRIPKQQAKRVYLYSGAKDEDSAMAWFEAMRFKETLGGLSAPLLLVHGENDELIEPSSAYENAALVAGPKEVRVVRGGDHLCNASFAAETLPSMLSWLRERLEEGSGGIRG
jgi:fermentation-respiration switch protein FrsA (DUF1100 family)